MINTFIHRFVKKSDNTSIPKRIFYFWSLNVPKTPQILERINSWRNILPDFDFVELNEDSTEYFNFQQELANNRWLRITHSRKMYDFVSDYVYIHTLYHNGGICLDVNIDIIKNINDLLQEPAFVGIADSAVDGRCDKLYSGILGALPGNQIIGQVLEFYNDLIWNQNIYTLSQVFVACLSESKIFPLPSRSKQKIKRIKDVTIFPEKYFSPYRCNEEFSDSCIDSETYAVRQWHKTQLDDFSLYFLANKHTKLNLNEQLTTIVWNPEHKNAINGANVHGNYLSFPEDKLIDLNILGKNNTVIIDKNTSSAHPIIIKLVGNNNFIHIGPGRMSMVVRMGFKAIKRVVHNCDFIVGTNNKSHIMSYFIEEDKSSVKIGDNNLFSKNIEFRCSDSHTIIGADRLPVNMAKSIEVGNDNWVCKDVTFCKNCKIQDFSVVGYRSIVTKYFDESHCLIVGSPAQIVKRNISWSGLRPDEYKNFLEDPDGADLLAMAPVYASDSSVLINYIPDAAPIEWRVDIKNHGDADNKVIVNMGGARVAYPSWYTNETGVGASVNAKLTHGDMEIVAVRDGILKLNFRGPDRRADGKRFPYWVDYSSIVIDDNEILTAPVATWHDKPFVYEMPVTHGQVVRVKFTQTPHKYTDTELSEFVDLVSQSDEMTPSEIIKLREYLSDAQK